MHRNLVSSSQIHSVGYDAIDKVLEVQFKTNGEPGGIYRYKDVPPETAKSFQEAQSLGKYLGAHIKNKFVFERVTA